MCTPRSQETVFTEATEETADTYLETTTIGLACRSNNFSSATAFAKAAVA